MNVIVETEKPDGGECVFRHWVVSVNRLEELPDRVEGEIRWAKYWDIHGNAHVLGRKGSRASAATEARG